MFNPHYVKDTALSQIHYLEGKKIEKIPDTEEEAWKRAKQGYFFPPLFSIGSLNEADLSEIAQYQPNVDLKLYKDLQTLNRSELLRRAPTLEILYPYISKSDIFFYLTRGWLPSDINAAEKIQRYDMFHRLTAFIQQLFLLLYPTVKDFAVALDPQEKPLGVKLEENLFLYDQWLGLPSAPFIISRNLGIEIPRRNFDVHVYFFTVLETYIRVGLDTTIQAPLGFQKVIEMSSYDWDQFKKKRKITTPYETRTDYVMQTYYSAYV